MRILRIFVQKYGSKLCAFALCAATLATQSCRTKLYEPEEPEGLREFVKR